ncbi:hypothetical protein FACS1894186_2280 [Alphaproteobacteria bacterium]|nr:hypothetical protein FACS1894186_2280 [Alphaproteobacteria bacterium]
MSGSEPYETVPVAELGLDKATENLLLRSGCACLADLTRRAPDQLLRLPRIGESRLIWLYRAMAGYLGRPEPYRKVKVRRLGLSEKTRSRLADHGCATVADMMRLGIRDLRQIGKNNPLGLAELTHALLQCGCRAGLADAPRPARFPSAPKGLTGREK